MALNLNNVKALLSAFVNSDGTVTYFIQFPGSKGAGLDDDGNPMVVLYGATHECEPVLSADGTVSDIKHSASAELRSRCSFQYEKDNPPTRPGNFSIVGAWTFDKNKGKTATLPTVDTTAPATQAPMGPKGDSAAPEKAPKAR